MSVKDTNSFIIKANKIHNNQYLYNKSKYINAKTYIIVTCKKHGDFQQTPSNHLSGFGCTKCGYEVAGDKNKIPKSGFSFADKFPHLIKNWSPKNLKGPHEYTHQSAQKIWWLCDICRYEWFRLITDASRGGCPSCSGLVLSDKNRLSILFPQLLEEWDYNKNISFSPDKISIGSHEKIWWICKKCNYSWEAILSNRARVKKASGCAKCNRSKGENKIEEFLIKNNIKYQTQYRIKECKNKRALPFDFAVWINNKLILIEYHGLQHYKLTSGFYACPKKLKIRQKRDKIKVKFCKKRNIFLLIIPYTKFYNIQNILINLLERN